MMIDGMMIEDENLLVERLFRQLFTLTTTPPEEGFSQSAFVYFAGFERLPSALKEVFTSDPRFRIDVIAGVTRFQLDPEFDAWTKTVAGDLDPDAWPVLEERRARKAVTP